MSIRLTQCGETTLQIREWIDYALDQNDVGYLSNLIRVEWNKRFTRKFAEAAYGAMPPRGIIRISPMIWERAAIAQRRETIIHETCHLVAFHLHGTQIKPHGAEWKIAMENCGLEAIRCHTIPLIGINHFHVRACPNSDRCTVSRRDFGRVKRREHTLTCTLCNLVVTAEQVEC